MAVLKNDLLTKQVEKFGLYEGLLGEVSANFTREDGLPDELLPRIVKALED